MKNWLLGGLILLFGTVVGGVATAQQSVQIVQQICNVNSGVTTCNYVPVGASTPLNVTGSGGGTVTQGTPAAPANAWPVAPVVAGAVVSSTNPIPITGSITTTPGTVGTPDIGGYSNGGTATVNTGGSFGLYIDTPSGSHLSSLLSGSIAPGNNNIGLIDVLGSTGVALDSAAGTSNARAITIQGNAGGVAVPVTTKPNAGTFATAGCTVGTSSASCLAAGNYNHVMIQNTSASASIACTWSGSASVLNSSGSVQLQPGMSVLWGPNTSGVPSANGLNCIASSASAPLYVESN